MYRRQPVRLWSPLPRDECLYRLIDAAGDPARRSPGAPVPPLHGRILDERITVSNWAESAGDERHSYAAQLAVVAEPGPRGGTTLTGTVGVPAPVLATRLALLAVACVLLVAALALLVAEVVAVLNGTFRSASPVFLLLVSAVPAFFVSNEIRGPGRYRRSVTTLLATMTSLIGARLYH